MKKIMAVYDSDPFYAERFADFINQREKIPLTVMAFTSIERLERYGENHEIEILLVSSQEAKRAVGHVKASQVMLLSDGSPGEETESYPAVYKYQPSDNIIREVMACYGEENTEEPFPFLAAGKIMGVYSPVNRCLKTSFALTLGQVLAQEEKTIYVNLEEFSGLSCLMNEVYSGNLSDMLYYYRRGQCSWARLSSAVYSWGNLDYIPPARYPEDLSQTEGTHIAGFLTDVARSTAYSKIIVDIGQYGNLAGDVLEICDIVYMPIREDGISAAKIEEFEKYLEISGRGCIKEHIKKIKLPPGRDIFKGRSYVEQMIWGEMGDYVRSLLKGGGGFEGEN